MPAKFNPLFDKQDTCPGSTSDCHQTICFLRGLALQIVCRINDPPPLELAVYTSKGPRTHDTSEESVQSKTRPDRPLFYFGNVRSRQLHC